MTAERAMDAAIGVLLGWKWMAYGYLDGPQIALYSPQEMEERAVWTPDAEYPCEHDWDDGLPHYSTSDADALAALDAVMAKRNDTTVSITNTLDRLWECQICQYVRPIDTVKTENITMDSFRRVFGRCAPTRALAICRAIIALAEKEHGDG